MLSECSVMFVNEAECVNVVSVLLLLQDGGLHRVLRSIPEHLQSAWEHLPELPAVGGGGGAGTADGVADAPAGAPPPLPGLHTGTGRSGAAAYTADPRA